MFTAIYTDQGIIRKVLRGNADAFAILLDRYEHIVYGVAYARTGNAADAEEITQDTFVRLYQWLDRIAGRSSIGPWLVEVARNAATDLLRQRRRETTMPAAPAEQAVAARDFARDELRRMVWEHLADLDETHREVLILHYLQAVKIRDIARLLGISSQAAAKRLQRSRDELGRRLLDAIGEETAAARPDSGRARKVMAAIAAAPHAWQPSPALSLAGAAIVGASAAKVVTSVAVAAVLIAIGLYAGWRHINRPYDTQNITTQSEFSTKPTEPRAKSVPSTEPTAPAPDDAAPQPTAADAALAAARTAAVYGLVLDQALKPVPGATVRLDNGQVVTDLQAMLKRSYYPYSVDPVDLTVTSNDDGSFYFDNVSLAEDSMIDTLHLSAGIGNLYGEKGFRCTAGLREQYVELVMGPAASLTVRVVDQAGAGISEAKVMIFPGWGVFIPYSRHTTAADGSVTIPLLMPGPYEISAGCEGYAQVLEQPTLIPGQQTLVLRLIRGNSISGRLTFAGDGSPIPDVTICTFCRSRQQYSAKTDAAGKFQIYGLDADTYEFRMADDAAPYVIVQSPRIPVTEGVPVTGIEVQAVEGAYVSGSILDEKTAQPVPHIYMIFTPPQNNITNGTWPRTYSDDHGRYSVGPLIPNTYEVILRSSSGLTKRSFTLSSLEDMQGVNFKLEHHMTIAGAVFNAAGEAVPAASVVAAGRGGDSVFAITDNTGRFSLSIAAAESPVYLQAFSAGLVSRQVGPARDGNTYDLQLQPAARIEGIVVDTAGRPQPGMFVVAVPDSRDAISIVTPTGASWYPGKGVDGAFVETSPTGTFLMDPVLPGEYELQVYAKSSPAGYPAATANASVREGQTLHTRLVLDTGTLAAVEGQVVINGEPTSGVAYVSAKCEGEQWLGNVSANTDAEGNYRLSNLRPGRMTIWMFARRGETKWERSEGVDLSAGETGCGFDGFVTLGDIQVYARLSVLPAGSADQTAATEYQTDSRGYYRAADLQEGTYDIQVQDLFYPKKVYATAQGVQAKANEITRLDFAAAAGNIEGTVAGIRDGEVAHVALFPETADFSNIAAALSGEIIASVSISPGDPFKFEQLPAGVYYVGAVAVPADKQSDDAVILANITKGRYTIAPIEILPSQTASLDLVIP